MKHSSALVVSWILLAPVALVACQDDGSDAPPGSGDDSSDGGAADTVAMDMGAEPGDGSDPGTDSGAETSAETSAGSDGSETGADSDPATSGDTSGDTGEDGQCTPELCGAFEGALQGDYSHRAAEMAGQIVVNEVACAGSFSATVDFDATPALQGTATCSYPGSLGGFDAEQTATIEAQLWPDGTVEGSVTHVYGPDLERTYSLVGTIEPGALSATVSGSLLPHPMSAVPWEVTGALD
ncbi:MAG: hypothetical protein AAF721_07630 [Myxococcota bacterium]